MSVATWRVTSVWFTKKYECKPHNMKYVAIVTVHLYKVASDYQSMQTTWENHCWRSRVHCKSVSCQEIRNTKFISQETSQQIWDWHCSQQQWLWIISVTNTTYNIPECGFSLTLYSRITTESEILSLYGNTWVRKNPYSSKFYAVKPLSIWWFYKLIWRQDKKWVMLLFVA